MLLHTRVATRVAAQKGMTGMHMAVRESHVRVVKLLLDNGATVDDRTRVRPRLSQTCVLGV